MVTRIKLSAIILALCTSTLLISSCGSKRNLVYFSDLPKQDGKMKSQSFEVPETEILPNDVLSIIVVSSSTESNNLFNSTVPGNGQTPFVYKVNASGFINFPGIKEIKLGGLSLSEAKDALTRELSKMTKSPNVSISFVNFKITVIGEVSRPGTFTITNSEVNLLEALGMAGDMTPFGRRDNVLVIRNIKGIRTLERLNINSVELLNSPYYFLKQNDIVYVEPDKSKEQEVNQNNRFIPIISASFSVLAVLISILVKK